MFNHPIFDRATHVLTANNSPAAIKCRRFGKKANECWKPSILAFLLVETLLETTWLVVGKFWGKFCTFCCQREQARQVVQCIKQLQVTTTAKEKRHFFPREKTVTELAILYSGIPDLVFERAGRMDGWTFVCLCASTRVRVRGILLLMRFQVL